MEKMFTVQRFVILVGGGTLILLVMAAVIFGRFSPDVFQLFLPAILPLVTYFATLDFGLNAGARNNRAQRKESRTTALILSILYLTSLYGIFLLQPFSDQTIEEMLGWAQLFLSPLQAALISCLTIAYQRRNPPQKAEPAS